MPHLFCRHAESDTSFSSGFRAPPGLFDYDSDSDFEEDDFDDDQDQDPEAEECNNVHRTVFGSEPLETSKPDKTEETGVRVSLSTPEWTTSKAQKNADTSMKASEPQPSFQTASVATHGSLSDSKSFSRYHGMYLRTMYPSHCFCAPDAADFSALENMSGLSRSLTEDWCMSCNAVPSEGSGPKTPTPEYDAMFLTRIGQ